MAAFSMSRVMFWVCLFNILTFGGDIAASKSGASDEEEKVRAFMEKSSQIFEEVLNNFYEAQWAYASDIYDPEANKKAGSVTDDYNVVHGEHSAELSTLLETYPNYEDKNLAFLVRQFLLVTPSTYNATRAEYNNLNKYLVSIYQTRTLCPYSETNLTMCHLSIYDFESEYQNFTKDHERLVYLWSTPKDVLGSYEGSGMYTDKVKLWDTAAKGEGYEDAVTLDIACNYLENTAYDDLTALWDELRDYYEQLMYYVNHKMCGIHKANYTINVDGLAPMEYFGGWPNDFSFKSRQLNPFYESETRMKLEEEFSKNKLTPTQFAKHAEELLVSMGLEKLHDSFWENSYFEAEGNKSCGDYVFHMADQQIYAGMCANLEMSRLGDVYKNVAISHHFLETDLAGIHSTMRTVFKSAFYSYIDDSITPLLLSSTYLAYLEVLPGCEIDEDTIMYYLFQEYLQVIPKMANAVAFQLWIWNVYKGEISEGDYNCELYKLIAEYQGFKPPEPRSIESFDIVTNAPFLGDETFTGVFFGNIVKYQVFMEMCIAGNYDGDLHECNLFGNEDAGTILKALMQPGISLPFKQLFKDVLQKDIFDTAGIKEYFRPVYEWIEQYNKENDARLPWSLKGAEKILCKTSSCKNDLESESKSELESESELKSEVEPE